MNIKVIPGSLRTAARQAIGDWFVENQFKDDTLITSEGYVEVYNLPIGSGYRTFSGLEGCGYTTYLIPILGGTATVVVNDTIVTEFIGILNRDTVAPFYTLPGVILPEKADQLRQQILKSIEVK